MLKRLQKFISLSLKLVIKNETVTGQNPNLRGKNKEKNHLCLHSTYANTVLKKYNITAKVRKSEGETKQYI